MHYNIPPVKADGRIFNFLSIPLILSSTTSLVGMDITPKVLCLVTNNIWQLSLPLIQSHLNSIMDPWAKQCTVAPNYITIRGI